jgi:hypothetical protein
VVFVSAAAWRYLSALLPLLSLPPYQRPLLAVIFSAARFGLRFATADLGADWLMAVASAGAVCSDPIRKG